MIRGLDVELKRVGRTALTFLAPLDLLWRLWRRRHQADLSHVEAILLLAVSGIGDLVMASPVIRALRRHFSGAKLTLVVLKQRGTAEVFRGSKWVDEVLVYDTHGSLAEKIHFLLGLRQRKFDLSLTLYPCRGWWGAMVSFVAGVKMRLAHEYRLGLYPRAQLLYHQTIPVEPRLHYVDLNLELLRVLSVPVTEKTRQLLFPLSRDEKEWAREFLRQRGITANDKLIGIHPGCRMEDAAKRWPAQNFVSLIEFLGKQYSVWIILFGGPDEGELVEQIAREVGRFNPRLITATGMDLKRVAALISCCDLFVNTDSGLGHIAAAFGTKQVTIFGPAVLEHTRPFNEQAIVVRENLPCSPCYKVGEAIRCNNNFACLRNLPVKQVTEAIAKLLG